MKSLSRARLLATSWTAAYQAPLSMGFSRQVYWSGLPLPSPSTGIESDKNMDKVIETNHRGWVKLRLLDFQFISVQHFIKCLLGTILTSVFSSL